MEVAVSVKSVLHDPTSESQIVVLREDGGTRTLPIWVGMAEGNAIRLAADSTESPRPLTHELFQRILGRVHAEVTRVLVREMRENTFYATIFLHREGKEIPLDARPSDAIALALREGAPIFASDDLMVGSEADRVQAWLENLKPRDFEAS